MSLLFLWPSTVVHTCDCSQHLRFGHASLGYLGNPALESINLVWGIWHNGSLEQQQLSTSHPCWPRVTAWDQD